MGRTKQWGTETLGDLWTGEGWGRGTRGIQDGHYRDFQAGKQGISGSCVCGGLTGVEKIEVLDGEDKRWW